MNAVLIKIFATALALSQVTTRPDAIKTQFDPVADQAQVVQILRDGCAHMRKAFDIEDINLDSLITTAMDDPKAVTGDVKAFKGLNFNDLYVAYRQFCKNEAVESSPFDAGEVITFFNKAMVDLPPDSRLKNLKPGAGFVVLDGKGTRYAEIYPEHRRDWISIRQIPNYVQKAFVTAEDKRFYQHKGIDERGLIRAFITNLAEPGRPQGGSTITQQVAKNLVVGDDVTYERKMREMIVASRLESLLSKDEILELYLNSIYLGRGAWGIELAARNFFGKSAKDLTVTEGAQLAGLAKGPNFFNPERHPERAKERLAYVLGRMQEDGVITAEQARRAEAEPLQLVAAEAPARRDSGFYFVDQIPREVRSLGLENLGPETIYCAFDHSAGPAAGSRNCLAGRLGALRSLDRPRPLPRTGDQPRRGGQEDRGRASTGQTGLAAGARRGPVAALRPALDAGGRRPGPQRGRHPGRSHRWPHPATRHPDGGDPQGACAL